MKINRKASPKKLWSKTKHLLIAGVSGFGKGNFGEAYISKFSDKGVKVFDLNSESRGEGMLYGIPQTDSGMKTRLNYLSDDRLKPKAYKNEIIMFLGHNLGKLQKLPANVKVSAFNEEWLTNEDLKKFLAFNDSQVALLEGIFEIHDDQKLSLSYLYNFLSKAAKSPVGKGMNREARALKQMGSHYMSVNTIKRRARALLRSGLFYRHPEDMKHYFWYLDLDKSLSEVDTITSFSTYLIEDSYIRYVCVGMLLKKFIEIMEHRQTRTPMLFYLREANDFFYMQNPPQYVIDIQDNISKILRKGRSFGGSEVTVVMDTQLLYDLPDQIFNGFNKFICFRLPLSDSKRLLRKASIPPLYLENLSKVEVGTGMYIINGTFQYPYLFYPTLHKKNEPNFDVFNYLSSKYGVVDYNESSFLKLALHPPKKEHEFLVPDLDEQPIEEVITA